MNLTSDQLRAIESGESVSVVIHETECVVIRKDLFEKVQKNAYDDSEWTADEMRAMAAYAADAADNPEPIT